MSVSGKLLLCLAVGAVYGALTSIVNAASSPYNPALGSHLVGTGWASVAEIAGLILSSAWAWAAVAVAAGWVTGTRAPGAAAGIVALLAATTTYYAADAFLRQEPFLGYLSEMGLWWVTSVILGGPLGAIGASIGRPGLVGLLAGLAVPVGAAMQMVFLPPVSLETTASGVNVEAVWATSLVWVAAAVGAALVVARWLRAERAVPSGVDGGPR